MLSPTERTMQSFSIEVPSDDARPMPIMSPFAAAAEAGGFTSFNFHSTQDTVTAQVCCHPWSEGSTACDTGVCLGALLSLHLLMTVLVCIARMRMHLPLQYNQTPLSR